MDMKWPGSAITLVNWIQNEKILKVPTKRWKIPTKVIKCRHLTTFVGIFNLFVRTFNTCPFKISYTPVHISHPSRREGGGREGRIATVLKTFHTYCCIHKVCPTKIFHILKFSSTVESPLFSGPFLLTELLLPMLMHSQSARIIMVSSELHKYGDIAEKIEMMDDKSRWSVYGSYNHTKLANV